MRPKAPVTEQCTTMRLAVTPASNAALPKSDAMTRAPAAPARSTSGAAAGRRGNEHPVLLSLLFGIP